MTDTLAPCAGMHRRRDLESDPLAVRNKPKREDGEIDRTLWQYSGTNVVQWWEGRTKSRALPVGPLMRIQETP